MQHVRNMLKKVHTARTPETLLTKATTQKGCKEKAKMETDVELSNESENEWRTLRNRTVEMRV